MRRFRRCHIPFFALIFTVALSAGTAPAAPRSGRSGRMVQAQRKQEIARLQKQLENARDTLDRLSGQMARSESDLAEARTRAAAARQDINEASSAHKESRKKLEELEHQIIDQQSDDSEFAKALAALETAQHALDAEMHRVLKWPAPDPGEKEADRLKEFGNLTREQRTTLKENAAYKTRQEELHDASDALNRAKTKLFTANTQWKRLHDEQLAADKAMTEAEHARGGASNDRLEADQSLRSAAEIRMSLQQTIQQIEGRIRALGGRPDAPSTSKPPASSGKK